MENKLPKIIRPPAIFKPLLWSFRWRELDVNADKEDIIVNAVNEGNLTHWHWLIQNYGKSVIRRVIQKRLVTEFHPESLNLARIVFNLKKYSHAH